VSGLNRGLAASQEDLDHTDAAAGCPVDTSTVNMLIRGLRAVSASQRRATPVPPDAATVLVRAGCIHVQLPRARAERAGPHQERVGAVR
jgi:hypothetical protein